MVKHLYCCQNTIQNLYDHIIPVPDDFDINPDCLSGVAKEDFISGLKGLTDIIKSVYFDMIQNPGDYGLPLVEDIEYSPFNPKAAESKNSSFRLVALLHTLAENSELTGGELNVHEKNFSDALKKLKSMFKVTNSKMIFNKLREHGFIYEKNVFSYHDNPNIIPALYGYMKNVPLQKPAVFSLNYNFAARDLPHHPTVFAEYLSGNDREFFMLLSKFLSDEGYYIGQSDDYSVYSYRIEYAITPKGQHILRFDLDSGKLEMKARFSNSSCYNYYIDALPESIKKVFRREGTCRFCHDCNYKIPRILDGNEYMDCGYQNPYAFDSFDMNDIEYYKQLIQFERKAIKTNARKKGVKVFFENGNIGELHGII